MVICGASEGGSVTSRLPEEWRGLFRNLQRSVESAVCWFVEETSSKYGSQPAAWHILISSLLHHEPHIQGEQLVFNPRFLLLPSQLQNRIIEFLIDQAYIIPDRCIQDLVIGVIKHIDSQSDLYSQLLQLAQVTKNSEEWLMIKCSETAVDKSFSVKHENAVVIQVAKSSLPGSQDCIIIDTSESDNDSSQEPEPKRRKLENSTDIVENSVDLTAENSIESENSKHGDEKSAKITVNGDGTELDKDICDTVISGKEHLVVRLKEVWQNCARESNIEGLKEVSKYSLKEIEEFCQVIDFDSMSDDSIELVCEHLCDLSDTLSYDSTVTILKYVLGNRIMCLSQNASRKLSGCVTLVCQKYPKHTVDSIIIPCVVNNDITSSQSEIICKILKEGLNLHTRGYFIQKLVQIGFSLTDMKIPVLQLVIDTGCEMTADTLARLLQCLDDSTVTMVKNLKFGKLLLAIVNKQSKLFTKRLKTNVEVILDKHESFLKKSIKSALNKIKV